VVVVDTNVPVVANVAAPQASAECVVACVKVLVRITSDKEPLVLDDGWWIIHEYLRNLNRRGQPGLGDAFLKWVLSNRANPKRCQSVHITPLDSEGSDFEEFPRDESLAGFDRADRKFVATCAAHPGRPPIAQAVDRKWWECRKALQRNGIPVQFVCPNDIRSC
jgi:hypothetical protein